jgi:hypothetical protein
MIEIFTVIWAIIAFSLGMILQKCDLFSRSFFTYTLFYAVGYGAYYSIISDIASPAAQTIGVAISIFSLWAGLIASSLLRK